MLIAAGWLGWSARADAAPGRRCQAHVTTAERARDLVWSLDKQPDVRELIGLLA